MKSLPAALQAQLDSGTTTLAWCWRIVRADDVVFGFTDHDRPLEFGGVTYEPESGFAASEIRSGTDLAVDAQEAEGVLTSDTITETDILDGRWDNAAVEMRLQGSRQRFHRRTSTSGIEAIEPSRSRSQVTSSRSVSKRTGTSNSKPAVTSTPAPGAAAKVTIPVVASTDQPETASTPARATRTVPATGFTIRRTQACAPLS